MPVRISLLCGGLDYIEQSEILDSKPHFGNYKKIK
jgi:hypothetical protein